MWRRREQRPLTRAEQAQRQHPPVAFTSDEITQLVKIASMADPTSTRYDTKEKAAILKARTAVHDIVIEGQQATFTNWVSC